jgi:hypothetical protein
MPYSIEETLDLRLELPAETRVLLCPRSERLEGGGALLETSVEHHGDAWQLKRRFVSTERSVAPETYPAIREVLLRRQEAGSNELYLAGHGGEE